MAFRIGDRVHWYVWDKDKGLLNGKISGRNYVETARHGVISMLTSRTRVVLQNGSEILVDTNRLAPYPF